MPKNLEKEQDFSSNIKTASDCSEDRANHINLVKSLLRVVSFDNVAGVFASRIGESSLKSADSFFYLNNAPVFIEFKNEDVLVPKNVKEICEKFYNSLMIYCFYADCHYDYFKKNAVLVLVYSDSKVSNLSRVKIKQHIANLSKSKIVFFGFSKLKEICKDVITLNENEFDLSANNFSLMTGHAFSYQGNF